MNKGKLTQNKVHLLDHEYEAVKYLLNRGFDIELVPPSNIKGWHTPDMIMNHIPWEIKTPLEDGKYTIKNIMQSASKQSENIVIDLRYCKMDENMAEKDIMRYYEKSKRIRRVIIIKKTGEMIDFSK